MAAVEGELAGLSLEDGEEEVAVSLGAPVAVEGESVKNCFVGSFLTNSVILFQSMRATPANVWHPIGGITITDLSGGRYFFRLYHNVDANRIEPGGPWTFNSHLLILHRLQNDEDPKTVPLFTVNFWVLIKELPIGFANESLAVQMGNFVGKFLDFDRQAVQLGFTGVLRVRVAVDIRKLLRRKKKILLPSGMSHFIQFAYEKLTLFCFICGKLGHGEGFCPLRILQDNQDFVFGWDLSLRAPGRRATVPVSKWLREDGGGGLNKESIMEGGTSGGNHGTGFNSINGRLHKGYYVESAQFNENQNVNLPHVGPLYFGSKLNNMGSHARPDLVEYDADMAEHSAIKVGDSLKRPRLHGSNSNIESGGSEGDHEIIISIGTAMRANRAQ